MHRPVTTRSPAATRGMLAKAMIGLTVAGCWLLPTQCARAGVPKYVVKELPLQYSDEQSGKATTINDYGFVGVTQHTIGLGGIAYVCSADTCTPVPVVPHDENDYAQIHGIDRHGFAVGTKHIAASHSEGFLWDGVKVIMVKDYHKGDDCYRCGSSVQNLNRGGMSVGGADADFLLSVAVLIRPNGKRIPIPTLPGRSASANDIASDGFVVGTGQGIEQQFRPWMYDGSTVTYLSTLGGYAAWASAVNNKHQMVGSSYLPTDQQQQGFVYENGTMTPIPFMYQYAAYSLPADINDRGQVIGVEASSNGFVYYLYEKGVIVDLATRLVKADKLRWQLGEVFAINNKGEIAATARRWADFPDGRNRAVVLVPVQNDTDKD